MRQHDDQIGLRVGLIHHLLAHLPVVVELDVLGVGVVGGGLAAVVGQAHDGHLQAAHLLDDVGLKLLGVGAVLPVGVGGEHGVLRPVGQGEQVVEGVVEVVVAQHGGVVALGVHHVHAGLALGHVGQVGVVGGVAAVQHQGVGVAALGLVKEPGRLGGAAHLDAGAGGGVGHHVAVDVGGGHGGDDGQILDGGVQHIGRLAPGDHRAVQGQAGGQQAVLRALGQEVHVLVGAVDRLHHRQGELGAGHGLLTAELPVDLIHEAGLQHGVGRRLRPGVHGVGGGGHEHRVQGGHGGVGGIELLGHRLGHGAVLIGLGGGGLHGEHGNQVKGLIQQGGRGGAGQGVVGAVGAGAVAPDDALFGQALNALGIGAGGVADRGGGGRHSQGQADSRGQRQGGNTEVLHVWGLSFHLCAGGPVRPHICIVAQPPRRHK